MSSAATHRGGAGRDITEPLFLGVSRDFEWRSRKPENARRQQADGPGAGWGEGPGVTVSRVVALPLAAFPLSMAAPHRS